MSAHSADVQRVLSLLETRISRALGENLLGLYVFGSLVNGDFDEAVSDLDLVAVTSRDLAAAAIESLADSP